MTAEPAPTPQPEQAEPEQAELGDADAFGRLAIVDPATLELEVNTRTEARLDAHFCASIRDRGVRVPIEVRRRKSDGVLVVRTGQRRTLAAVRVGLHRVPVIIAPEPALENSTDDGTNTDSDTDDGADDEVYRAGQVERIVAQLGENQHRRRVDDADEVAAHQQLLGLGLSAAQIAKATRTQAARVRATTRAAQSPRAAAIGARYELDLMQMGVLAEFDGDDDAVKALTVAAVRDPDQFTHLAQRLRDDRADQQLYAATVAELTEAGVTILDGDDDRCDDAVALYRLRPAADDPSGTVLNEDAHRDCPGHAATVDVVRGWREEPQARVHWVCLDPAGHGHVPRYDDLPSAGGAAGGTGGGGVDGETDEERAAREAREREARSAERARVIANNKAWDSAQTVRRDWLAEQLLARKSAPKGAGVYVAAELGQGDHALRRAMESGNTLACELLGLEEPDGGGYYTGRVNPLADAARAATAARAAMLALAMVLAAYEAATTRDDWRRPGPATQRYFTQLRDWGYPLSDVETLVLDPAADQRTDTGAGTDEAQPGPDGELHDPAPDTEAD